MFWRTDPTAPNYISHVAIYLGNGQMIQAPQPGQNVEVVPAAFGSGFAGIVPGSAAGSRLDRGLTQLAPLAAPLARGPGGWVVGPGGWARGPGRSGRGPGGCGRGPGALGRGPAVGSWSRRLACRPRR